MSRRFAIALIGVALSGCASVNQMAFDKTARTVDTSVKSVVLMTLDVHRSDDSRFVPVPLAVKFERPNAKEKDDYQNFKLNADTDAVEQGGHTLYLARMALIPGKYRIDEVVGTARAFPISGLFEVPLMMTLDLKPNSVVYVGRLTAELRARQGDEFRAGPLFPLIDQAVAGMSGSTWDITVADKREPDMALFRAHFPALATVAVEPALVSAFDRSAIQRWWDGTQPPATHASAGGASAPAR